jgi:hypothetical protein
VAQLRPLPSTDVDPIAKELHKALLDELLRRIREGSAVPSDLNVARQFLKDNGLELMVNTPKPAEHPIVERLNTYDWEGDNRNENPRQQDYASDAG